MTHARPDAAPHNIDCGLCGKRRGFLPGSKSVGAGREHVDYLRSVLAKGWTLPLAGVLICIGCDLDPHRRSFPRLSFVMDIGTPEG